MAHPTLTYLVTNPGVLFHPDERITLRSAAPADTVVRYLVNGRLVRVLLTDTPLPAYGHVYGADLRAYL
ncbi:hypothetical protein [Streptomyces sp. NPDC090057]|uniref:hypothetical protein n=1 Tax=Streptomyces sp. NPDC090057 TaxID=3365935 RepID=UPI0037FD22F1